MKTLAASLGALRALELFPSCPRDAHKGKPVTAAVRSTSFAHGTDSFPHFSSKMCEPPGFVSGRLFCDLRKVFQFISQEFEGQGECAAPKQVFLFPLIR